MIKKIPSEKRIEILNEIGNIFRSHKEKPGSDWWESLKSRAFYENGWFSPDQVEFALNTWTDTLTPENIQSWSSNYELHEGDAIQVGIIMAGNIPFAGLHDILSVILTGNRFLVKPSKQDKVLIPALFKVLIEKYPGYEDYWKFTEGSIQGSDFFIATGSGSSARTFLEFFEKYPHLVRGHRNSMAVLTGRETEQQLYGLGEDVFTYYGLGCRSVSKIFVPENYDHDHFFKGIFPFKAVGENGKYGSNFDYYRAVYMLNEEQLLENGFVLYKEDAGLASPPSVIFWQEYKDLSEVMEYRKEHLHEIQCVVGETGQPEFIPFGSAQKPGLSDFADGQDTVAAILNATR